MSKAWPPLEKYPSQRPPSERWKIHLRKNTMTCPLLRENPGFSSRPTVAGSKYSGHLSPCGGGVEHPLLFFILALSTVYWERWICNLENTLIFSFHIPFCFDGKHVILISNCQNPASEWKTCFWMTSSIFQPLFLSIPFNNYCSALFVQGVRFEGPCCGFVFVVCSNTAPTSLELIFHFWEILWAVVFATYVQCLWPGCGDTSAFRNFPLLTFGDVSHIFTNSQNSLRFKKFQVTRSLGMFSSRTSGRFSHWKWQEGGGGQNVRFGQVVSQWADFLFLVITIELFLLLPPL